MESDINLLPEKDKQLAKPKPKPKAVVEMTTPKDRVVQERVVRTGGLMDFFRNLFPKKPQTLVKNEQKQKVDIPSMSQAGKNGPAPVTKLETMADRFSRDTRAQVPAATPPQPPAPSISIPSVPVPPPPSANLGATPKPTGGAVPTPPPVRKAPAWAPPPPGMGRATQTSGTVVPTPPPAPKAAPAYKQPPPPIPTSMPDQARAGMAAPGGSTNAELVRAGGLDVNLVPEEYQPEVTPKDKAIFGLSIGVALVLVAAIIIGLQLYTQRVEERVANVQEQLDATSASISGLESSTLGRAQVLQRLTGDVKKILDQHVYWDTFFQKLEAITLPSVTYTNMSVDVSGTVSISAVGKTYKDVGDQLLIMQQAKDFVTDVSITSATKSSSTSPATPGQTAPTEVVTFSIALKVVPSVFYQAAP